MEARIKNNADLAALKAFFCFFTCLILLLLLCASATGCGTADPGSKESHSAGETSGAEGSERRRKTRTECLTPTAPGTEVLGNEELSLDVSCISSGYAVFEQHDEGGTYRAQITAPDGTVCNYSLRYGFCEALPLQAGDGTYRIAGLRLVEGSSYALLFSETVEVRLDDEFLPFLYPNQYCRIDGASEAFALSMELSDASADDLDYLTRIYRQVTRTISYDTEKAASLPKNYIPDVDETLAAGTGICFDYAALMTALLRCQGIPTKLVVGYSGTVYHAWISVYLSESGWVDNVISFDGSSWSLMDPTLAASNDRTNVKKYVGDGENYTIKYWY